MTQLDAIRGIAVSLVCIAHAVHVQPHGIVTEAVHRLLPTMLMGVDLFFVLSGFLITGILIHTREQPGYFRRFYVRRVLRILPAYYTLLVLIFLVLPHFDEYVAGFAAVVSRDHYLWIYVLHLQNILFAIPQPDLGWPGTFHFWSLAVEEQFYLVWPCVVLATPPHLLRRVCVGVFLGCAAVKALEVGLRFDWVTLYMGTPTRIDGLAAGAFVATLSREEASRWVRSATLAGLAAGALIIGLSLATRDPHNKAVTAIVTSLGAFAFGAALLRVHARAPALTGPLLKTRPLVWMGTYSYGIYLLHLPILMVITGYVRGQDWVHAIPINQLNFVVGLVSVAITLPIAWAMFRAIEKPALDLRFKLAPDPIAASVTKAEAEVP